MSTPGGPPPPMGGGGPPGMPPGMPGGPEQGGGQIPGSMFLNLPPHHLIPQIVKQVTSPKKKPKREKPTEEKIRRLEGQLELHWDPLHQRMDEDWRIYCQAQEEAIDKDVTGNVVIKNVPYTSVEKVANMLGSQLPDQDLVIPHDSVKRTAQKVENLTRYLWMDWEENWVSSGQGPLQRSIAHYAALRGWISGRVIYDPEVDEGENPIRFRPMDPRDLYPLFGTRGLRAVIHKYKALREEVIDDFPDAEKALESGGTNTEDETEEIEVVAYYDDHWHAVYADEIEVKAPTEHGYGFNPIVMIPVNGSPIRSGPQGNTSAIEQSGPSLFHGAKHALTRLNKILSQLSDVVEESANPPIIYRLNPARDAKDDSLDLEPGGINRIWNDEDVQPLDRSPNPGDLNPLIDSLLQDIEQATIPSVLWGAGSSEQSGFAIALLSGAAKDATFGIVKAMESFYQFINERALTLLAEKHTGEVGVVLQDERGYWMGGESVTPEEIRTVGMKTQVRFRDVTPEDRAQQAQLAIALVREHLISPETARSDYLALEDPHRENERVVNSLLYQDEEIMKNLIVPMSLYKNDPEMFELWSTMVVNKIWDELQKEQEQQMQQQMGPPPDSIPGAAGMPPTQGMPPGLTPAPMGPEMFDSMGHAGQSAAGGAGMHAQQGIPEASMAPPPTMPPMR